MDGPFEVIVSRMKLRMRKIPNPNPNPNRNTSEGKLNLQYWRKHVVVDGEFDHIIDVQDFPKRVHIKDFPIISALSELDNDLDPESCQLITKHVLAFDRQCCQLSSSSVSIDVDIKEVTGSYLIGEDEEFCWDEFKDGHWKMTHDHRLIEDDDDKDYHVVEYLDNIMSSSYALVPCGGRGHLKAVSFRADEVTRACTSAICLVDFEPYEEAMMNVLKIMPCGHVFHRRCIVSWIRSNSDEPSTCPLCCATMQFF